MNNDELLRTTKTKFSVFVKSLIEKYISDPAQKIKCEESLTTLERLSSTDWTAYILENIVPYEKNIKQYVVRMIPQTGLTYETLTLEEHMRFERFIMFFVKITQSTPNQEEKQV